MKRTLRHIFLTIALVCSSCSILLAAPGDAAPADPTTAPTKPAASAASKKPISAADKKLAKDLAGKGALGKVPPKGAVSLPDKVLTSPNNARNTVIAGVDAAQKGQYKKAFMLFNQACTEGNPAGCFGVGSMYLYGVGTYQNTQEAMNFYQIGCSSGDPTSCSNLAMLYDRQNATINKKETVSLYATACDGGDMLACTNVGWMYANGAGTKKDINKAMQYYKIACDGGSDLGCYNLGLMSGMNTPLKPTPKTNATEDMNYRACMGGDQVGCANLGYMYANGIDGVKRDYYMAAKYFDLSCKAGVVSSCNNLGVLYMNGTGVVQNFVQAMNLFSYACNNGIEAACKNYKILKEESAKSRDF